MFSRPRERDKRSVERLEAARARAECSERRRFFFCFFACQRRATTRSCSPPLLLPDWSTRNRPPLAQTRRETACASPEHERRRGERESDRARAREQTSETLFLRLDGLNLTPRRGTRRARATQRGTPPFRFPLAAASVEPGSFRFLLLRLSSPARTALSNGMEKTAGNERASLVAKTRASRGRGPMEGKTTRETPHQPLFQPRPLHPPPPKNSPPPVRSHSLPLSPKKNS